MDFTCGSAGKESACNVRDLGLIAGWGRFPGEEKGYPLQYSGLENAMDYIVHGVTKSQTRLSDFHFQSKSSSIPGLGRSPGKGNDNPLQYSCLGNPMERGAWWSAIHRVA